MSSPVHILCSLLLAILIACPAHADPKPEKGKARNEFNGKYEVTVSGAWKGSGKVTVGGSNVNFKIKVVDAEGNSHNVHCPGLDLDENGRFTGAGDIDGRAVTVSGRVDDPFGKGTPRISGTVFDEARQEYARFAGDRKGD